MCWLGADIDGDKVDTKTAMLLEYGVTALAGKDALMKKIGDDMCQAEKAEAKQCLTHGGHFGQQRIDEVIAGVLEVGDKNKVDNATSRQKQTGVTSAAEALELIAHSKSDASLIIMPPSRCHSTLSLSVSGSAGSYL